MATENKEEFPPTQCEASETGMEKQIVRHPDVPETGGPYNNALIHENLIYISGLTPFGAEFSAQLRAARATGQPPPTQIPPMSVEAQTHLVMKNMCLLLEAGGSNIDCLLKVVVWLSDLDQMRPIDNVYKSYFSAPETMPTRTRIETGRLPFGCAVEIDAIGYVPKAGR